MGENIAAIVKDILIALVGGGSFLAIYTYWNERQGKRRKSSAEADLVQSDAGAKIIAQAQAVVEMWQAMGKELQARVTSMEGRITALEDDCDKKAARIDELEKDNDTKAQRITELEREVERLQAELEKFKQGRKR